MTKQEIAALSVRILALYIVVNAVVSSGLSTIPYIEQQWYASAQGVNPQFGFGSIPNMFRRELLDLLFPLAVALLLWKFAHKLGTRMVQDTKAQASKQSVNSVELQTILISVIGLFVAISSIPQLLIFFFALSTPSIPEANFSAVLLQLIIPLLSLLLGGILLFNASQLSHFLQRERAN